jgi:AraC family transcriptional regulator
MDLSGSAKSTLGLHYPRKADEGPENYHSADEKTLLPDVNVIRRGFNERFAHSLHQTGIQPTLDLSVLILDMPDMEVASVRLIGPYNGIGKALSLLHCWGTATGMATPETLVFTALYDSPALIEPEQLRSDVCMTVPLGTEARNPVYVQKLKCAGKYACGHFEFWDPREFPSHWKSISVDWLATSGCLPDLSRPMLEIYRGDPMMLDGMFRVDICVPIRSV